MTEHPEGGGPGPGSDEAGHGAEPGPPSPDVGGLVGTVLAGRYQILKRLGVGAMGAVYLGEHLKIGRRDAIKVLKAGMASDPEAIARFTRGARNVSRIRHSNVCTLYDFGDTAEGFHFLAMEFVDGPTLGGLMEMEGPLEPRRAVELIAQVGEALQAAHRLGIVHRDLKPDNIMVARDGEGIEKVKVVDFDIARGPAEDEGPAVTRHGFVVGTPEYMSPEQLTGDPLDGRSDIYSMALVLFRILTGQLPFAGDTAQEIMVQRLTQEPMTLSEVSGRSFDPALEAALGAGLRRKADERPADARSFAQGVKAALEGQAAVPAWPGGESGVAAAAAPATVANEPAAPGSAAPPSVPGTRVGAPPPPELHAGSGGPPSTAPAPAGVGEGRSKLPVILAIAAVVVFLLAASVVGAGFAMGWFGRGDVAAVSDDPGLPAATVVVADATDPDGIPADSPGQAPPPPVADPPPTDPPTTQPPTQVTPPPTRTEPPTQAAPPPTRTDPPALEITVPASDLRQYLFTLFSRLGDDDLPRNRIEGVRDTVDAARKLDLASREDRAFAEHILGLALIPLGDSVRGVDHLEEAVRLDPIDRYITVLRAHRGGGR